MASCFLFRKSKSFFLDFQYTRKKDPGGDARNILMVVVTLIAAVTFQNGVSPPGGVWQDTKDGHVAGKAIYASREVDFYVFVVFNTLALSTSVLVIMCLTYNVPFQLEVLIATASVLGTYASAIFAVTPADYSFRFRFILIPAAFPFVLRALIYVKCKAYDKGDGLCDRCRSENSEDNCRKCGSEIPRNSVRV